MWKSVAIAALLVTGCSNSDSPAQINAARQRLLALTNEEIVGRCEADIQKFSELIEEMDMRVGVLERRKKDALASAYTDDEINTVNRLYGYDLRRALDPLSEAMAETQRAIVRQCPKSSERIRAEAQSFARYPALSKALTTCADGTDRVLEELAKRVPDSWKGYSETAVLCWAGISAGAKADGVSSTPVKPSADRPAPAPTKALPPAPTPEPSQGAARARDGAVEDVDTTTSDLAGADARLNQTWVRIRPRFSEQEWGELRGFQRQWIRERDERCGSSEKCARDMTVARIDWLNAYRVDADN